MASKWEYTTLGKCADWYSGGTPRKSNPEYWGGDIPWVSAKSLKDFYVRDSEDRVTSEGLKSGTRLVPTNAILFVVRGMSLKSEFRLGVAQRPVSFNQDIKAIVAKDDYLPYFLAYILKGKTAEILDLVEEAGHGTGVLSTDVIKNIEIPAISKAEQKRLIQIFQAIDDKIELNRRMNATLEGMAQALFKSWFVDFDPVLDNAILVGNPIPEEFAERAKIRKKALGERSSSCVSSLDTQGRAGTLPPPGAPSHPDPKSLFPDRFEFTEELGWIPEGWEVDSIYSLIDVIYGAPFKSSKFTAEGEGTPVIRIRDLKTGKPQNWTEEDHPKKTLISTGDIVVGMDAEFRATIWPGREAYLNQRLFLAKPKVKAANSFFIQETLGPLLEFEENTQVGTTVAHLGKKEIDRFKALSPSELVLDLYAQTTDPLLYRLINNLKATANLTRLRDTLLPKLISGELQTKDVGAFKEEVIA